MDNDKRQNIVQNKAISIMEESPLHIVLDDVEGKKLILAIRLTRDGFINNRFLT